MSWGLFFDMVLVGFSAAAQCVTGYLGWRVTVDGGVSANRRKLYEGLFVVCALLGLVATVGVAYRGGSIGKDLEVIKSAQNQQGSELHKIEANIKQQAYVHLTAIDLSQYKIGDQIRVNNTCTNTSDFIAREVDCF